MVCDILIIQCGWDYKIFHKPAVLIFQIVEYLIQNFKMHLKFVIEVKIVKYSSGFKLFRQPNCWWKKKNMIFFKFSMRKRVEQWECMSPIWKPNDIVLTNRLIVNKTKTLHKTERCSLLLSNWPHRHVNLRRYCNSANDYNHKKITSW